MRIYFEVTDTSLPYGDSRGTYMSDTAESADLAQLVPQMAEYNKSDIKGVRLYIHSKKRFELRQRMFKEAHRNWEETEREKTNNNS